MKKNFIGLFDPKNFGLVVLGSGPVTAANALISGVDGTAFIDFSTASILTDYLGGHIVIKDSTGKILAGYIKAAGTGETYTDVLGGEGAMEATTDFDQVNLTPVTNERSNEQVHSGSYSRKLVSDSQYDGIRTHNNFPLTAGELIFLDFWSYPSVTQIGISGPFAWPWAITTNDLTAGTWNQRTSSYGTVVTGNANYYLVFQDNGTGATCYIDDAVINKVLTPSATGVTIVTAKGGTTYNWSTVTPGFDYNDALTYTIYQ